MRNKLLLLSLLLIFSYAQAQEGLQIGLRFSPIVSFANITDSTGATVPDDLSTRLGLSYGLSVNYGFQDNVGLHTGLHIVNKGYRRVSTIQVDSAVTINDARENVRITTVEIPLALRGRTNDIGGGFHIVGTFGATIDISTGYRNQWENVNPATYEVNTGGEGQLNQASTYLFPIGLSFVFGAGVDWEIDRVGTVNLGLTYHQGLTNINTRSGGWEPQTRGASENIRINYVALDLSFFFGS